MAHKIIYEPDPRYVVYETRTEKAWNALVRVHTEFERVCATNDQDEAIAHADAIAQVGRFAHVVDTQAPDDGTEPDEHAHTFVLVYGDGTEHIACVTCGKSGMTIPRFPRAGHPLGNLACDLPPTAGATPGTVTTCTACDLQWIAHIINGRTRWARQLAI